MRQKKSAAVADKESYFLSYTPLSTETDPVPPLIGGGVRKAKEKPSDTTGLGRCQQSDTKGETAVILFIVFAVGICGDG